MVFCTTTGNVERKEEEWVGRKENKFSLASLGLQHQKDPLVEVLSQELATCGAKAWERFWYTCGYGRQLCVRDSMAWLGRYQHSLHSGKGAITLCSHGGSDTRALELYSFLPPKMWLSDPCLPRSQRPLLDYSEEPHRGSLRLTCCLALWLPLPLRTAEHSRSQPHKTCSHVFCRNGAQESGHRLAQWPFFRNNM